MTPKSDSTKQQGELARAREELLRLATEALAQERWQRWRPHLDLPLLALFVALMTLIFAPPLDGSHPLPALDSVAPTTIRAERDILIEDRRTTKLRQSAAAAAVLPVYDYDSELFFSLGDRISSAVGAMAERREAEDTTPAERRAAFEADLGVPVKAGVFALIEKLEDPLDLSIAINFFLNIGLDRMILANRTELPESGGIEVRDLGLGGTARPSQLGAIIDLRQFRRLIQARAGDAPYGDARVFRSWVIEAVQDLAAPNLRANEALTRERRQAAIAEIDPVFVRIKSGEVLVRSGDRVTKQVRERIAILNEGVDARTLWGETAAVALLLVGVVLLASIFFRHGRVPHRLSRKQVIVTLSVVLATAALSVGMYYAGLGLAEGLAIGPEAAAYFVPLAVATTLVSLLIDARTSLLVGIGLTLLVAYRVDGDLWLVTYYFVGTLVAGIAAGGCRRRTDLLRAGLMVALAQAAVVPLVTMMGGETFGPQHLPLLAAALASGVLVAVATLGLLPVLEQVFDEASDMRLLELASSDHPLLKRLALVAPGSYYASLLVSNLSEAAADVIGANGLKARVMALYHDIGKAVRPGYFAENQREDNIHDRLAPETSARIILAHVHDGIETCQKERLGPVILAAIAQHQGTTLLKPFYAKALARTEASGQTVEEADYRYPGPKPQSREAGILLLADSVEAATRALANPAPPEVRARVASVIADKVQDGQLDECELTMRDLAAVQESFTRTLTLGVFHNRIEYPALPVGEGESVKDSDGGGRVDRMPRVGRRPA